MRASKVLLWLQFFILMISSAHAQQMHLKGYLKEFLRHDELLQVRMQEWQIAIEKQGIAADVYASKLSLKPERKSNKYQFKDLGFTDRTDWITLGYEQNTPWGMGLGITSSQLLASDLESSNLKRYKTLSLTLTQSLWKNSFGSLTRLNRDLAEKQVEQVASAMNLQHAKSCQQGMTLYLDAFLAQQKVRILSEQYNMTERALKLSERAYKRRQVQRLDVLGARADHVRIGASFESSKIELKEKMASLLWPLGENKSSSSEIAEPNFSFSFSGSLEGASAEEINFQTHPAIEAKQKSVEFSEINLDSKINENRSNIDLGVEWSKQSGQGVLSGQVQESEEDVLEVFIKAELPLFEKTRSAKRDIAEHELRIAKLELQREKEDQLANFEKNRLQSANYASQIKKSEEKIKLYNEQVKIGLRFLDAGRIEFNDYQRYREQLLNERFSLISLKSKLWNAEMQWAFDLGKLDNSCGGIL